MAFDHFNPEITIFIFIHSVVDEDDFECVANEKIYIIKTTPSKCLSKITDFIRLSHPSKVCFDASWGFNPYTAKIDFSRQNLTSLDLRY